VHEGLTWDGRPLLFQKGCAMDQVHEKDDAQSTKDLLREVLKVQETILLRLEQLEGAIGELKKRET
jgi:hypothetical protein